MMLILLSMFVVDRNGGCGKEIMFLTSSDL